MGKQFDIVALGELLIDFTPAGYSAEGMRLFEQNPGGAPANMLTAASRFGLKTAFIGKVGDDMHGHFLKSVISEVGIDASAIQMDASVFTTMAFVDLSETGERNFSFARKPGADTMICYRDIDKSFLANSRIFHVGSLSLTDEPARTTTFEAVKYAKKNGTLISYDPNYRASLWTDEEIAIIRMQSLLPYVDLMKISDEETSLLTPYQAPEDALKYLLAQGKKLVAVTLGREGVLIGNRHTVILVKGFQTKAVDTTGAGDSFWGGVLAAFLELKKEADELSEQELEHIGTVGNAVASLCVEKRGGISAIPDLPAIKQRLEMRS